MKMKKIIIMIMLISFSFLSLAQDDFGDWGEEGGSDLFSEELADTNEIMDKEEGLVIESKLSYTNRGIIDNDKILESKIENMPELECTLKYKKDFSEVIARILFNEENKGGELTEGEISLFYDNFVLKLGKMKVTWGKGDKVHVLDNLNSANLIDPNKEYIDSKIAKDMIKVDYYLKDGILELVYIPYFVPDKFALEGKWSPEIIKQMNLAFEGLGLDLESELNKEPKLENSQFGARFTQTIKDIDLGFSVYSGYYKQPTVNKKAAEKLALTSDKAKNLESDQIDIFAKNAEITATTEGVKQQVSAGLIANGINPGDATYDTTFDNLYQAAYNEKVQPLQNELLFKTQAIGRLTEELKEDSYYNVLDENWKNEFVNDLNLHYDRVTVLGAEFATIKLGMNLRGELAYNLTEDIDGNDPCVKNNSIGYVLGGDKDFPINNLNINVQIKGNYIVNNSEIKGNYDTDYNKDDKYLSNSLIAVIADKYFNERVNPQLTVVYNVRDEDYVISPELELELLDSTEINIKYTAFSGDAGTTYGDFKNLDYLQTEIKYFF